MASQAEGGEPAAVAGADAVFKAGIDAADEAAPIVRAWRAGPASA